MCTPIMPLSKHLSIQRPLTAQVVWLVGSSCPLRARRAGREEDLAANQKETEQALQTSLPRGRWGLWGRLSGTVGEKGPHSWREGTGHT